MWVWRPGARRVRGHRPCAWLLFPAAFVTASAEATRADPSPPAVSREIWAGADISRDVWLLYSGITIAPWSGIHDPGWRFRAAGGYGGYAYEKEGGPVVDKARIRHFDAATYFGDVLLGYLWRYGELTAKGFVGASIISHDISPLDEETVAIGPEVGVKGVIELWLNIGERGWASLDVSWSSAHNTRAARTRVGYRIWPKLSVGLEAGLNLDAQGECRLNAVGNSACYLGDVDRGYHADLLDYARGGAFARYEWDTSEASVSVGVLGDSLGEGQSELSPYVTVNWLTQF